jgi:uncharacterized membrane protein
MAASTPPVAVIPQPADSVPVAGKIKPIDEDSRTTLRREYSTVTVSPDQPPREAPPEPGNEPEIPRKQQPAAPLPETTPPRSDLTIPETEEKPEPATTVSTPSQTSEAIPPSGEPPAPQKPGDGLGFKFSKKVILGITVVIIILGIVLGAFFLYPVISNSEGVTPDNGTALTPVPTIIKNSGTAVFPTQALKPAAIATDRPTPGNSGSTVGL